MSDSQIVVRRWDEDEERPIPAMLRDKAIPRPEIRTVRDRESVRCAAKIHVVRTAGDDCPMCNAIAAGQKAATRRSAASW